MHPFSMMLVAGARLKLLAEVWRKSWTGCMKRFAMKVGEPDKSQGNYVALRIGEDITPRPESDYPTRVAPG